MSRPTLVIERDPSRPESACVSVRNLPRDLMAALGDGSEALLRSVFQVTVNCKSPEGGNDLPCICGRYQLLEHGVRFAPCFPFDPGVALRATFDVAQLGYPEFSEALTLEFSLPEKMGTERSVVTRLFPSAGCLPENLLRFYACFSNPMQRGWAEKYVSVRGSDGRPVADVLYRPPLELWDRSMRYLTLLLDPGRLKRGVGPNRLLGPPLRAGEDYMLVIDSGMVDVFGCQLSDGFCKPFRVKAAIREPIALERWRLLVPAAEGRDPLELLFPAPLDWAELQRAIRIVFSNRVIAGHVAIDQDETRWRFIPESPWESGSYQIRVAPGLEDVCGNNLLGAFDAPLRSHRETQRQDLRHTITFSVMRHNERASAIAVLPCTV
jgi:hypothetical protein